MLSTILTIVLCLIAVPLILALFVNKNYAVQREVIINKPVKDVFDYVKVLRNQRKFSTWEMMDPNMKQTYTGIDGAVGSTSAWDGDKNVGKGQQELKNIVENKRVDIELRFEKPFASVAPCYFSTEAVADNQTRVIWAMSGKMNYPMNFMQLFNMMDKMIGKQYEDSLQNLKKILEA